MHTYLEFKEGKSSKFWELTQNGTALTIRYGRIGTDGRTQEKTFDDDAAARKEASTSFLPSIQRIGSPCSRRGACFRRCTTMTRPSRRGQV